MTYHPLRVGTTVSLLAEAERASAPEHAGALGRLRAYRVEIVEPARFASLETPWRDLVRRTADPNAFAEPALVAAAGELAPIRVLLAWADDGRLCGAWPLALRRPSSGLPLPVLKGPVHDHACLGGPVIAASEAGEVAEAMLEALRADRSLPGRLEIASLDPDGASGAALLAALASGGARCRVLETRWRPALRGDRGGSPGPSSAERGRALRRRRRRLAERGAVSVAILTEADAVAAAADRFVALEAAGWKGARARRGRAIGLCAERTRFFRTSLVGLARLGLATIVELRLDDRPVATQVILRSGDGASTWKTAYDETLRACAPGLLLLAEVGALLARDPGLALADSCNHRDDGYMAEFWPDRRRVVDILVDLRPRGLAFPVLSAAEIMRRGVLSAARRARNALRARKSRTLITGRSS